MKQSLCSSRVAVENQQRNFGYRHMKACDFRVPHNAICFPPKILYKFCFQFLEEKVLVPEEIEYNTCTKLCGENKLNHGQSETRQFQLFLRNLFRNFWIKIQKYEFILCFSYSIRSKVCKSDLKEHCHVFKILPKDRPTEKLNRTMSIFQWSKIWPYLASWLLFRNNARPSVSKSGKTYLGTAGFKLQDIAKVEWFFTKVRMAWFMPVGPAFNILNLPAENHHLKSRTEAHKILLDVQDKPWLSINISLNVLEITKVHKMSS